MDIWTTSWKWNRCFIKSLRLYIYNAIFFSFFLSLDTSSSSYVSDNFGSLFFSSVLSTGQHVLFVHFSLPFCVAVSLLQFQSRISCVVRFLYSLSTMYDTSFYSLTRFFVILSLTTRSFYMDSTKLFFVFLFLYRTTYFCRTFFVFFFVWRFRFYIFNLSLMCGSFSLLSPDYVWFLPCALNDLPPISVTFLHHLFF